jgi:hypothetical protein
MSIALQQAAKNSASIIFDLEFSSLKCRLLSVAPLARFVCKASIPVRSWSVQRIKQ